MTYHWVPFKYCMHYWYIDQAVLHHWGTGASSGTLFSELPWYHVARNLQHFLASQQVLLFSLHVLQICHPMSTSGPLSHDDWHSRHYQGTTSDELWKRIEAVWNSIPQTHIHDLLIPNTYGTADQIPTWYRLLPCGYLVYPHGYTSMSCAVL